MMSKIVDFEIPSLLRMIDATMVVTLLGVYATVLFNCCFKHILDMLHKTLLTKAFTTIFPNHFRIGSTRIFLSA